MPRPSFLCFFLKNDLHVRCMVYQFTITDSIVLIIVSIGIEAYCMSECYFNTIIILAQRNQKKTHQAERPLPSSNSSSFTYIDVNNCPSKDGMIISNKEVLYCCFYNNKQQGDRDWFKTIFFSSLLFFKKSFFEFQQYWHAARVQKAIKKSSFCRQQVSFS